MIRKRKVLGPSVFVLWLLVVGRIFGGAYLLWELDAPAWAIAAWLMLHVRFRFRLRETARDCD